MELSSGRVKKTGFLTLTLLFLVGILAGCAQPQPTVQIPLFKPTTEPTISTNPSTPFPSRPIYPPGTLVDYTAQDGDTMISLASHFNTSVEEIIAANPLIPATITTLQVGTQMKIPIYYKALWGSQFQIIPDSLFINGPAQIGFDTRAYVNSTPGWLKYYSAFAGDLMRTGGELVDYVAQTFSISPRLLLAVAEYQAGALTDPTLDEDLVDYTLGYVDQYHKGFYLQLVWAAGQLNDGYYKWRNGRLEVINRTDGTMEVPDPWQNAATVALQYYFSQKLSYPDYIRAIYEDGLSRTYTLLFGDPWQNVVPHIPGNLQQPDLTLPFSPGKKWAYTGGPHSVWGEGEPYGALDFAPPSTVGGCAPTDEFVVAMAPGLIVRAEPAIAVLDLDMDGDERTGWVIFYLHLGLNDLVRQGTLVKTGDTIGHPSCEGGEATGTHIHIARKFNGEWVDADSAIPFNMEGWIAKNGAAPYLGTLTRFNNIVTASESASGSSAITAGLK